MIQFILNNEISKGTKLSPFHYMFGSFDHQYLKIPQLMDDEVLANDFARELDEHLNKIREVAKSVQMKQMRLEKHPTAGINKYQVGDLVLENVNTSKFKKFKLQPKYNGPFEIVMIYKADITLKI